METDDENEYKLLVNTAIGRTSAITLVSYVNNVRNSIIDVATVRTELILCFSTYFETINLSDA